MDPNVVSIDGFYCIRESLSALYHTYKLNLSWIEIKYIPIDVFTGRSTNEEKSWVIYVRLPPADGSGYRYWKECFGCIIVTTAEHTLPTESRVILLTLSNCL
jgi:hypothetical protein